MIRAGLPSFVAWALSSTLAFGQATAVQPPLAKPKPGDVHLALGKPSPAKADPKNPDPFDYLMVKEQYALSYNSKRGGPNWVSYQLQRKDMGRAPRSQVFFPDNDLPEDFYQVVPNDYRFTVTAMTRGHMCPSSHRNATEANARATFFMTNMLPQTEELNSGSWELLESWCRDEVFDRNKEMFIVCGGHGIGGIGSRGKIATVGNGKVVVPKSCWKVVLIVDGGGTRGPLARVNAKSRLIGVLMPNTREPNENVPWSKYVVSVADIESLTGLRFFDKVAPEIINPLKKRVDEARNGDLGERELARLRAPERFGLPALAPLALRD